LFFLALTFVGHGEGDSRGGPGSTDRSMFVLEAKTFQTVQICL
jgi:hypothetical protein